MLSLRRATRRQEVHRRQDQDFYPRSPCGERRGGSGPGGAALEISIHALLAESDHTTALLSRTTRYFYPRSPCGERQRQPAVVRGRGFISIHALLAESDPTGRVGSKLSN